MNYEEHEISKVFPEMTSVEYAELKLSIQKNGFDGRHPIMLYENKILDGRHRYKVCLELGVEPSYEVYSGKDPIGFVVQENVNRRHLEKSQRAAVAVELLELYQKEAKDRQGMRTDIGELVHTSSFGRATDKLGETVGVSGRYIDMAREISENNPDIFEKIKKGEVNIKEAKRNIRRSERSTLTSPELPEGEYEVLYADPPWSYDFEESENRNIENQYPTMKLEDIKELEVPATENSVLFLWATAPKLKEALEVMNSWGFTYKTHAIWDKGKLGMGYWFRGRHELLLVGTKGDFSPPLPENREPSVYQEVRGDHSVKPTHYYEWIEQAFPNKKYLELFARSKRPNWQSWGNENDNNK